MGMPASHIAKILGKAKSTLFYEIKINGGKENYDALSAHERWINQLNIMKHKRNEINNEHIRVFKEGIEKGYAIKHICALARVDTNKFLKWRQQNNIKYHKAKPNSLFHQLHERIDSLQMQIDIILDFIKEKNE